MFKIALCEKADKIPSGGGWLFERKIDGIRCISVNGKLYNRESGGGDTVGKEITEKFPEVKPPKDVALDGELSSENGVGSLTGRVNTEDPFKIKIESRASPATYMVFDVLATEDENLRPLPLSERKKRLDSINLSDCSRVEVIPYYEDGNALWKRAVAEDWEGLVAKKKQSPYPNGRSSNWLKIKNWDTELFEIKRWETTEEGGFVIVIEPSKGEEQRIVVNDREEQRKIAEGEEQKAEIRFLERSSNGRLRHISYVVA